MTETTQSDLPKTASWAELWFGTVFLGAGVFITRRYVLAAAHVLRALPSHERLVSLRMPESEDQVDAVVLRRESEVDLALLHAGSHASIMPPRLDRCAPGDAWLAPYRPSNTDPYLAGSVPTPLARYKCEGGATIDALQLTCEIGLGDYSGYSGAPVERRPRESLPVLLGILLEQYPDRASPTRATNVLFAATIGEAFLTFEELDARRVGDALLNAAAHADDNESNAVEARGGSPEPQAVDPEELAARAVERVAAAEVLLAALRGWADTGLLNLDDLEVARALVARRVIDTTFQED